MFLSLLDDFYFFYFFLHFSLFSCLFELYVGLLFFLATHTHHFMPPSTFYQATHHCFFSAGGVCVLLGEEPQHVERTIGVLIGSEGTLGEEEPASYGREESTTQMG